MAISERYARDEVEEPLRTVGSLALASVLRPDCIKETGLLNKTQKVAGEAHVAS